MADERMSVKVDTASNGVAANGGGNAMVAKNGVAKSKSLRGSNGAKLRGNVKQARNARKKGKDTTVRIAAKKDASKSSRKIQIASEDLPRRTLAESLPIAQALRNYANSTASWEEIAEAIGVSASNPNNKYPLWAAVAYGLVMQDGDQYALAEVGRKIIAPEYEGEDQEGRLKAILTPRVLSQFYTDYNGNPLPPEHILSNVLENRLHIPRERVQEARNILITNAREVGILRPNASGVEIFQFSPTAAPPRPTQADDGDRAQLMVEGVVFPESQPQLQPDSCFVITPIGGDGSPERKHADAVLKHLIEPVLSEVGIAALRADKITKPGIINKQIVEQLAYSKLCIADLSFNNPNAFYEMGVRHAFKLPMIQIIRKGDKIPFDVAPGRTIQIDCSDPYSVLDAFKSARSELKEHVECVLKGNVTSDDEPMALYLPALKVSIPPLSVGA